MLSQLKNRHLSKPIIVLLVLLLVGAVVLGLEKTGVTNFWGRKPPSTKTRPISSEKNTFAKSPSQAKSNDSGSKDLGASTATLLAPSGAFVSNHHPNLDGSPAPNQEQSVCNTTPGATCKIEFKKDGVTKSLPTATADDNGNVYWSWNLSGVGLTEGSWTITATATSGTISKISNDSLNLEVGP